MLPIFIIFLALGTAAILGTFMWRSYNNVHKQIESKISDQGIIRLTQELGGTLSAADLVARAGLSMNEAQIKIQQMLSSGILTYGLRGFKVVYQLSGSFKHINAAEEEWGRGGVSKRMSNRQEPSDSEVLAVAVKSGGKLTVNALCLKLGIPVEVAKSKLESLQEKGVFEIQVSESGNIVYWLPDIDLLTEGKA